MSSLLGAVLRSIFATDAPFESQLNEPTGSATGESCKRLAEALGLSTYGVEQAAKKCPELVRERRSSAVMNLQSNAELFLELVAREGLGWKLNGWVDALCQALRSQRESATLRRLGGEIANKGGFALMVLIYKRVLHLSDSETARWLSAAWDGIGGWEN
jgi:hypothetical protein